MARHFKLSLGELTYKETIIVALHTADGLVGYGESSTFPLPTFTQETTESCMHVQTTFIAPRLVEKEFTTVQSFRDAYADLLGNPIAQAGMECAFWHLLSQYQKVSLKELVGGTKKEIPVGESISINPSLEETLREVEQRLNEGYVRIKLKIMPGWDTAIVSAVRNAWPHIELTVDGNMSYRLEKHERVLRSLDAFRLTMIEQPFKMDNLVDHAALQRGLKTAICLDESITSAQNLATAHVLRACKIVNIKPVRVGGLDESLKIYDYALSHGIAVWCGGMFETGIGRAFNIALASKEGCNLAADMSPYNMYLTEDLIDPSYEVKPNGHIDVPDEPGLGYHIRVDRIKKYTLQKEVIT